MIPDNIKKLLQVDNVPRYDAKLYHKWANTGYHAWNLLNRYKEDKYDWRGQTVVHVYLLASCRTCEYTQWLRLSLIENGKARKECPKCKDTNKYVPNISKETGKGWRYYGDVKACAKKRRLDFLVSQWYLKKLFITQNYKCTISKIPLELPESREGYIENRASLDRIDSSKGYIEGNVHWIHYKINIMKMDMTSDEFLSWCRLIVSANT